ncbi:MAG: serine/threonine protein kinase [Gammaproteobacteria bacterium SG8_47]|nr:MAG: serine/threonine protein kinase [Gammaproteobacteria bacterium SG8_47]
MQPRQAKHVVVDSFDFKPGRVLAGKYEVVSKLGGGWEGEVYLIRERATGIERTAKLFFPQRNPRDRAAKFYAKKLHILRQCPIVIQYLTQDSVVYRGTPVTFLISEFVEGELLSEFLRRQPGHRLSPFQALHLLHALASGIECIHQMGEYHGDLHTDNIIVQRYGLGFELKLLDMFHWGKPRLQHIHNDTVDLIHIFHEALGGQARYAKQPPEVKAICRGLKRSLILENFRTAGELRAYLETMQWA